MQLWEYNTTLVFADAEGQRGPLSQRWPTLKLQKYSPEGLIPRLNEYGAAGWELVSIEPVYPGRNDDILLWKITGDFTAWYLCTFKRPLETP